MQAVGLRLLSQALEHIDSWKYNFSEEHLLT